MDKQAFLSQDPGEVAWNHEALLTQLLQTQRQQESELAALSKELAGLGVALENKASDPAAGDDLPHPYGMCRDSGCEGCVSDAQEVAIAARRTAFDDIDRYLLAAGEGNEKVVAQVAQMVQLGRAKLEQVAKAP